MALGSGSQQDATAVLDVLSRDGMLWLSEVPNRGARREPLYARLPGIRGTGVYLIRDLKEKRGLFYVGKVVQDPAHPDTTNPNADGIIGRLSGHQNMMGSNVLARWYKYIHPDAVLPSRVLAGPLRDHIQFEAATRMLVTFCQCPPGLATQVEAHVIKHGLPGEDTIPLLNSPNWRHARRGRADTGC